MNMPTLNIEKRLWKRLGLAGFAFFLVKGLIWLAVPIVLYWMGYAN